MGIFFRNVKIVFLQKRPLKFLLSRILRDTGILRLRLLTFKAAIDCRLYLHSASLPLAIWIDREERHEDMEIIKTFMRPGETYVDIGANIGHLAILAAKAVGEQGRVYAFEAHYLTYNYLLDNLRLNHLTNCHTGCFALGATSEWISLSNKRSDDQNCVIEKDTVKQKSIRVPQLPLDALSLPNKIDLLKIDVEGYEKFVLDGAPSTLKKTQFIYFEAYDANFKRYDYYFPDIVQVLNTKGFNIIDPTTPGKQKRLFTGAETITRCCNLLAFRSEDVLKEKTGWEVVAYGSDV